MSCVFDLFGIGVFHSSPGLLDRLLFDVESPGASSSSRLPRLMGRSCNFCGAGFFVFHLLEILVYDIIIPFAMNALAKE
jgi:hypothetical protein